ncbi:MAG: hypothetical protein LQ350_002084 [Teloschistes chrysophthalmus]|nr:MAG: hypothetical protein LQ350_002084 [Niorma chrysophthalma]
MGKVEYCSVLKRETTHKFSHRTTRHDVQKPKYCGVIDSYRPNYGSPRYRNIDRYSVSHLLRFQPPLTDRSTESSLDYYTRTAPYKYKRRIARHTGVISSADLDHTCAATISGQRTCIHSSTTAGDMVNYIPLGTADDVPSDLTCRNKLTLHFMLLLPAFYKPVHLQSDTAYHAALVITKNPIGPSSLLLHQPDGEELKAEHLPILRTLVFDAHSRRRSIVLDDEVEGQWQWKANTSLGYHIKIVREEHLHAIIFPGWPTLGLRLSDAAYQQVLTDLGEEYEELEHPRWKYLVERKEKTKVCAIQ